jgi:two-component system, sensor histidine kinase
MFGFQLPQIALLESKKSYVRHISHELRTPLNTAFLGLKLLTTDLKSSKNPKDMERYDTLCDVNMSCTAAVDILNDLLCYEKLESGILELHKENIFVEPFLRDCAAMFSAQARECGVTISTVIENTGNSNIPSLDGKVSRSLLPDDAIYADKFKMDQVIRNLVSNALKFTPRGGNVTIKASFVHDACDDHMGPSSEPMKTSSRSQNSSSRIQCGSKRINISTFLHRSNRCVLAVLDQASECNMSPIRGQLVVVVTDTGAGISKDNQARLFHEIVQFSPEKLQAGGGSGLGLWITQEILNLHDGSISVSSEGEGMGSSFTMRMPMTREPPISVSADVASSPFPIHLPELESYMEDESNRSDGDGLRSVLAYRSSSNNFSVTDHGHSICSERVPRPFEVLVVDDSRMCRKMLLKCLRADGHTCFEAEDGLEAIAMVKERIGHATGSLGKPFDAVLMDFIMPNMDGPTATQEIRALGYTAPIFGVTGNGEWKR